MQLQNASVASLSVNLGGGYLHLQNMDFGSARPWPRPCVVFGVIFWSFIAHYLLYIYYVCFLIADLVVSFFLQL